MHSTVGFRFSPNWVHSTAIDALKIPSSFFRSNLPKILSPLPRKKTMARKNAPAWFLEPGNLVFPLESFVDALQMISYVLARVEDSSGAPREGGGGGSWKAAAASWIARSHFLASETPRRISRRALSSLLSPTTSATNSLTYVPTYAATPTNVCAIFRTATAVTRRCNKNNFMQLFQARDNAAVKYRAQLWIREFFLFFLFAHWPTFVRERRKCDLCSLSFSRVFGVLVCYDNIFPHFINNLMKLRFCI